MASTSWLRGSPGFCYVDYAMLGRGGPGTQGSGELASSGDVERDLAARACDGSRLRARAVTEAAMATVKETFDAMPGRFKPDRAQGVKAQIQYDITGDGGGTYHADVADGTCAVREGAAASPALTLTMASQDWLDMLAGKLNGQVAFM